MIISLVLIIDNKTKGLDMNLTFQHHGSEYTFPLKSLLKQNFECMLCSGWQTGDDMVRLNNYTDCFDCNSDSLELQGVVESNVAIMISDAKYGVIHSRLSDSSHKGVGRGDVTESICEFYINGNISGGEEPNTDYHVCVWRDKSDGEVRAHMSNGYTEGERTRGISEGLARKLYLYAWEKYYV